MQTMASVALCCLLGMAYAQGVRNFTDRQGRTVSASLVSITDDVVELRMATGSSIRVPIVELSEPDQEYIRGAPEVMTPGDMVASPVSPAAPEPTVPLGPWDYSTKVSGMDNVDFRIWLPDANTPVRGMIALVPGSNGDGRAQATDKFWQDLAGELGFGLIACFFKDSTTGGSGYCYAARGSGAALLEALEAFGKEHSRPEMKTVPLLLWGHSAGGQFNYNFACWKPQRTLGFVVNKGGFYYDTPCTTATRAVPAMLFIGGKDTEVRMTNITKLFDDNRARGALWALCVEPNSDHGVGNSREVTRTFFRSVVVTRLKGADMAKLDADAGWLGDLQELTIAPASKFKGNIRKAAWFPDEATAQAWMAVVQ